MTLLKSFGNRTAGDRSEVQDEFFLFVHMPKTGGQTLLKFFLKHLLFHKEFIHLGPYGLRKAQELNLLPFEHRPAHERMQARVILGHNVTRETHQLVPGKTPRHVLFLREPAEALVSYYNFQMHEKRLSGQPAIDFDAWYDATKRGNMMTRWFYAHFMKEPDRGEIDRKILGRVMDVLQTFWFVGCTEFLDCDAPLLFKRIGLEGTLERTNVSGVRFERLKVLDPSLRDRLNRENPIDLELYQYWKERLGDSRARIGERNSQPQIRCL